MTKKITLLSLCIMLIAHLGSAIDPHKGYKFQSYQIILRSGHLMDEGGFEVDGLRESELNRYVCHDLIEEFLSSDLKKHKLQVSGEEYVKSDNLTNSPNLVDSDLLTHSKGFDLVITVHAEFREHEANGPVVYYSSNNQYAEKSRETAAYIAETLTASGIPTGVSAMENKEIRDAKCPAVMLSLGNLHDQEDRFYLTSESGLASISNGLLTAFQAMAKDKEQYLTREDAARWKSQMKSQMMNSIKPIKN